MCSTKLLDSAILLDECVSKVVKKIDHLLGLFGLSQRLICEKAPSLVLMWLMPHVSLKQCHCQVEFILLDECVSKVVKKIDHLLGLFGLSQRLICEKAPSLVLMWLMPHVSLKQCHCQVEFPVVSCVVGGGAKFPLGPGKENLPQLRVVFVPV